MNLNLRELLPLRRKAGHDLAQCQAQWDAWLRGERRDMPECDHPGAPHGDEH